MTHCGGGTQGYLPPEKESGGRSEEPSKLSQVRAVPRNFFSSRSRRRIFRRNDCGRNVDWGRCIIKKSRPFVKIGVALTIRDFSATERFF